MNENTTNFLQFLKKESLLKKIGFFYRFHTFFYKPVLHVDLKSSNIFMSTVPKDRSLTLQQATLTKKYCFLDELCLPKIKSV